MCNHGYTVVSFVHPRESSRCAEANENWTSLMRSAPKIVILFLSALFLFSVLTPEAADIQGYNDNGIPAFVESDAAYALCSSLTVPIECRARLGDLSLVEQAHFAPTLIVSSHLYRGPPLSFLS